MGSAWEGQAQSVSAGPVVESPLVGHQSPRESFRRILTYFDVECVKIQPDVGALTAQN
jgi:hypothetical protein